MAKPRRRHIDQDAVINLLKTYRNEVRKCLKARAYIAGCTMVGSVLDAGLTALTRLYPEHVRKVGERPSLPRTLGQLVKLGKKTGWLSGRALWAAKRIVQSRNKVHADVLGRRGRVPHVRAAELRDRMDDMDEVSDAFYKVVERHLLRRC